MYILNIKALKKDIIAGKMKNGQSFPYFFIFMFITTVGAQMLSYLPSETKNLWDHLSLIGNMVVYVATTLWLYKLNGGNEGHYFYDKYFSIELVTLIRYLILSIPFLFLVIVFLEGINLEIEERSIYDFFLAMVWMLGYNLYFVYHFGDVVRQEKESETKEQA